jgi:hypothetical protein
MWTTAQKGEGASFCGEAAVTVRVVAETDVFDRGQSVPSRSRLINGDGLISG